MRFASKLLAVPQQKGECAPEHRVGTQRGMVVARKPGGGGLQSLGQRLPGGLLREALLVGSSAGSGASG